MADKQTLLYELEQSATLAHVLMRQSRNDSSKYHLGTFKDCKSTICSKVKRVLNDGR